MKNKLAKIVLVLMLVVFSFNAQAQILHPVKWSYVAMRLNKTEAVVLLKATIDEGWHVYSQTVKEGGPIRTSFDFDSSPAYSLIGKVVEPVPITKYEKVFNMNVSYFASSVIFRQKIKLKSHAVTVKGTLKYMTCNDMKCLPPEDVDFSINIK